MRINDISEIYHNSRDLLVSLVWQRPNLAFRIGGTATRHFKTGSCLLADHTSDYKPYTHDFLSAPAAVRAATHSL